MRILLKGYYGFGNLGDDILMLVSFNLLKSQYPDAEITVFSNNTINNKDANIVEGYNNYISTILSENVKIIDWTYHGHFDLIFHGGGGVYFDNNEGPIYYTFLNKAVRWAGVNTINKVDKIIRLIAGKSMPMKYDKRIGIGIGVGPFHPSAKLYYHKMVELGSYDELSVRDTYSFNLLSSYKLKGQLSKSTDLSFLTDQWMVSPPLADSNKENRKIGIILKGHTEEIHLYYKKLAKEFEAENMKIEFFAFDEYYDRDYIGKMEPEFIVNIWQPNKINIDEFLNKLWSCSICITDRAHGAILGAIGNVIPMVIKSSKKSDQIVDILNLNCTLDIISYKKFYELSEILNVLNSKTVLMGKLKKVVQREKTKINDSISSLVTL